MKSEFLDTLLEDHDEGVLQFLHLSNNPDSNFREIKAELGRELHRCQRNEESLEMAIVSTECCATKDFVELWST
jgi:hypothetical protein